MYVSLYDILLASQTPTTLRFFLSKGLDLRSVAAGGVTDLMHRVLDSSFPKENDIVTVEFARILIGAGWDPALKNAVGETAIHVAARSGNLTAIKFFLSKNLPLPSDILLAAVSPRSGVNVWYIKRVVPLTRFLIREGASVNATASNGNTPLHLATMRNFTLDQVYPFTERLLWNLVEILLNSGSDSSARNADGQTPYDLAEAKGHFFKENFLRLARNSSTRRLHS